MIAIPAAPAAEVVTTIVIPTVPAAEAGVAVVVETGDGAVVVPAHMEAPEAWALDDNARLTTRAAKVRKIDLRAMVTLLATSRELPEDCVT
jgi:hypothetical protein